MDNFGILASPSNVDASKAEFSKLNFSTKYPQAKLDRTNETSFQNINLTFLRDTPNPPAGSSNSTLVYDFSHPYNYTPSFWVMGSKSGGYAGTNYLQNEVAWLVLVTAGTFAQLRITADSSKVYFYVDKSVASAFDPNPDISAISLLLRVYVFVEDLLGS